MDLNKRPDDMVRITTPELAQAFIAEQVAAWFRNQLDANLVYVDATDRFLELLDGVAEPEAKRKIIGAEFIRVVEEEARKVGDEVSFLAQGTIVPDFRATGVREGKRAYDWPCIIRCINTVDGVTAEVPGIGRVCYDLTPKPVGTVEWE